MVGVSFGVLSMGVITAWLTTMCQFPGRALSLMGAASAPVDARVYHCIHLYGPA